MHPIAFLASTAGRVTRIVTGLVMIIIGGLAGGLVWIAAAIGVIPLLTGAFDVCAIGPLVGQPFSGRRIRERFGVD